MHPSNSKGCGIKPGALHLICRAVEGWEKLAGVAGTNVTAETLTVAEEVLAENGRVFGGKQLDGVIDRVGAYLVPDGMLDNRPAQEAARTLELKPVCRGGRKGMYRVEGWLTAATGATAQAVLDPLAAPQPVVDDQGRLIEPDRRDRGMRLHDAFEALLDRSLRAGELQAHGGIPATLIITAHATDLTTNTGEGITESGDRLPMETVRRLADEAEIVHTVFSGQTGEVLYLGRSRRLASYPQTLALAARDGGCTFPGSSTPSTATHHSAPDLSPGDQVAGIASALSSGPGCHCWEVNSSARIGCRRMPAAGCADAISSPRTAITLPPVRNTRRAISSTTP
jgi:hypothetical protein